MPTSSHVDPPLVAAKDSPEAQNATHIYCRVDNPKSLMPIYSGPFEIISRPSPSTIQIKTGTFVSGKPMLELHAWSRCKPAFIREGAALAERPKRGRPTKPRPDLTTETLEKQNDVVNVARIQTPSFVNENKRARENSNEVRPIRSTRNQNPLYIDSVRPWQASQADIEYLNSQITSQNSIQMLFSQIKQ